MKAQLVAALILALLVAPFEAQAQRGRGPGGGGGGGGGFHGGGPGGGFSGRGGSGGGGPGAGANRQASRPNTHPYANQHFTAGHANFSHRPSYHGNWYHGDWRGNWGHPWAYRPYGWYWGGVGWGLGFGLGAATVGLATYGSPWGWGYYSYWNPYWVGPVGGVTYINYAQPVAAAPPPIVPAPQATLPGPSDATSQPSAQQQQALATFDMARGLFKRGDYALALQQANRAAALLPNDSLVHEFRALCLFATQDYKQSAAALYAVLSGGPGWDSATLVGLYANPAVYSEQLRALERYREENPQAASARFVLAYHYMLSGRNDSATAELRAVVELEPNDQLSAQLLKGLTTPVQDEQPPRQLEAPGEPVELASLVGDWKASRPDGSKFKLKLSGDNRFSWNYTQQDKQQQLTGTYTLADNYLILKSRDSNSLVGEVAMEPGDKLKFKLAGGSPSDPGLIFTR